MTTIDRSNLPPLYPTHRHKPEFWCSLGRAVATFGNLEQILKGAILALKGTCPAPEDEADAVLANRKLGELLENSLTDSLKPLIETFRDAARDHPESRHPLGELVCDLFEAAKYRNIICHASWGAPDENGASMPFFVTGRKPGQKEVFETPMTVEWLDQLQAHAAELACKVVDTVQCMGYQFPGGDGPGAPGGIGRLAA